MSDTGSPRTGLMPVVPQGQLERASTSGPGGPGQGTRPTYEELLCFYVDKTKWPVQQTPPPSLPYETLELFYHVHAERPLTPLPPQLPPPSIENIDAFLTEDEVVTKDEAKEAFASV